MNCELPDVQAGFRKGRGTRDQIANICWIIKKARGKNKKTIKLPRITKRDEKPNQQNVAFLGFYSALKLKVDLQVYQLYTSSEEPG